MFYERLIILNISTLNFSEGVPASVLMFRNSIPETKTIRLLWGSGFSYSGIDGAFYKSPAVTYFY